MKPFNQELYLKLREGVIESFDRMMQSLDENNQPDFRRVFEYTTSNNALHHYVQHFKHPNNINYRTTQYTDSHIFN